MIDRYGEGHDMEERGVTREDQLRLISAKVERRGKGVDGRSRSK